ncbi:hypothetical protein ABEB36_012925 [Hypothenemus hampei]|uniref:Major facilitator superfamily (MFS) profile domain-containing protein n=1 Tax=Hypothenemus hampei TaxID=57062 RepID=A0ABD1E682_HYPHA
MVKLILAPNLWSTGEGRTILAAICAHSIGISIGLTQGFSAIWLLQLDKSKEFVINSEQQSWLASLGVITNPVGSILSGIFSQFFGRRISIQLSCIPFTIGWILLALSRNIYWMYLGRMITGIAAGMSTASFTYVGEIATPNTRGLLQSLCPILTSFGILLVYILGYVLSWKIIAAISIIFTLFTTIAVQLLPESPIHLIKNHIGTVTQNSKLYQAFEFFNPSGSNVDQKIKESINWNIINEKGDIENNSFKAVSLGPETIKPFFLVVGLFLLQELSGIYSILFYATQFIEESNIHVNPFISSIIVGTIRFSMSIISAPLIQNIGRKTLCTFSGFGMAISLLILGLYIKYYELNPNENRTLDWLPLLCITVNVFFSMLGMLPIPWILVGEVFPSKVRSVMAGIVICVAQCFIFISVKIYNNLIDWLGFSGTIFSFVIASVGAMLYSKYILPETQGKSLHEIEEYFKNGKSKKTECDNA